jgi:hypothetical protein
MSVWRKRCMVIDLLLVNRQIDGKRSVNALAAG